ncbi:MAG: carbon-nitrogen hydrolase family protein [Kiritimatiellae bacterium]|nr:carbon-nitrogen hydrolase family protein [Kiritimatiellia bacterium]
MNKIVFIGMISISLIGAISLTSATDLEVNAKNKSQQQDKGGIKTPRMVGVSTISYSAGGIGGQDSQRMEQAIKILEGYIDTAALDKPDIIILTEGFLHNAARSASREEKDSKSEILPEGGAITRFLSRKASEHKTYIIASYWRKNDKGKGRYNSAVLLDRQGRVVGAYDKVYPTIGEMEGGVLPGECAKVFQTDFGKVGALICFDLNFRELMAEYKNKGAELICFLSAYRGGFAVRSLAFENQMFIASSVPGENSVIVDPMGRVLAESSAYGKIIFAKINLDSKVVHIDYNAERVADLKKKYQESVKVEVFSPEAVYFISSHHPEKSVEDMIKEFNIEIYDAYRDRARAERKKYLSQ